MITQDVLQSATGSTPQLAAMYLPYFNAVLDKYGINTQPRILAFLSQVGSESGGLKYAEEIASGAAYEGRSDLGNTSPGDGMKYKGRGMLEITGRANYGNVSNALGVDFVNNPQLLASPQYAVESAAWWWNNAGLNDIADTMDVSLPLTDPANANAFNAITKKINGGYNGLADRQSRWMSGQGVVSQLQEIAQVVQANPKTSIAVGITLFVLVTATITYYLANKDKIAADFKGTQTA